MEQLDTIWDAVLTISKGGEYLMMARFKYPVSMELVQTDLLIHRHASKAECVRLLEALALTLGYDIVLQEWADVGEVPPPDGEMPSSGHLAGSNGEVPPFIDDDEPF